MSTRVKRRGYQLMGNIQKFNLQIRFNQKNIEKKHWNNKFLQSGFLYILDKIRQTIKNKERYV